MTTKKHRFRHFTRIRTEWLLYPWPIMDAAFTLLLHLQQSHRLLTLQITLPRRPNVAHIYHVVNPIHVIYYFGRVHNSLAADRQTDWEIKARRTNTSCIFLVDCLLLMVSSRLRIALTLFCLLCFIWDSLLRESWLKR